MLLDDDVINLGNSFPRKLPDSPCERLEEIREEITKMLPTPSTLHVPFERVYEPAEDSYLLLDTLSSTSEKAFLQTHFSPKIAPEQDSNPSQGSNVSPIDPLLVAEIGTGSGVVLAFVTANANVIFGHTDVSTVGVDINVHACKATEETVRLAIEEQKGKNIPCGKYLGNFIGDLAAPLLPGSVDVLIFNPPYVPTAELPAAPSVAGNDGEYHEVETTFEEDSHFLELSYAGGLDGMETTDRLLESLPTVLNRNRGVAFILLCAQNKPEAVKERIRAWGDGWTAETVGSSGKKAGWEKLQIIRIWQNILS